MAQQEKCQDCGAPAVIWDASVPLCLACSHARDKAGMERALKSAAASLAKNQELTVLRRNLNPDRRAGDWQSKMAGEDRPSTPLHSS